MHWVEREEFDQGDKVRIGSWVNREWFEKHDPGKLDVIMTVSFQDGDDVWTDKGIESFECLELVEDE